MSTLTCGQRCLQIVLIIANILVFICGMALVTIGIISCLSIIQYSKDVDVAIYGLAVFITTLGVIIFFIGIIGCCGACNESVYKLTFYATVLFIIILCEIAGGIGALVLKDKVKEKFRKAIEDAVREYGNNPDLSVLVDSIQSGVGCCGANSPNDYKEPPPSCFSGNRRYEMMN
uniref:Tetraspanin n=1 Tax=Trichobilharzia regenti TaxID=157069 RepID=A0AA85JL49_TRIRE|nr:unnamed protein product [Trichobilharzia regenti]